MRGGVLARAEEREPLDGVRGPRQGRPRRPERRHQPLRTPLDEEVHDVARPVDDGQRQRGQDVTRRPPCHHGVRPRRRQPANDLPRDAQPAQRPGVGHLLQAREQLVLLVAHVLAQHVDETVEQRTARRVARGRGLEAGDELVDLLVLALHLEGQRLPVRQGTAQHGPEHGLLGEGVREDEPVQAPQDVLLRAAVRRPQLVQQPVEPHVVLPLFTSTLRRPPSSSVVCSPMVRTGASCRPRPPFWTLARTYDGPPGRARGATARRRGPGGRRPTGPRPDAVPGGYAAAASRSKDTEASRSETVQTRPASSALRRGR